MAKLEQAARKSAKKRVPFVVRGIEAKEVSVTGDFTGWSEDGIRLAKGTNGDWQTTLALDPGQYQYRLRVDGEWRDNPAAEDRIPNPFGTENAVLKVG